MSFQIDFFELMFLVESVIPEKPIARSHCFDSFSNVHYHKMTPDERKQFFEHVQNCYGFTLENEQCRHFFARFNPENQYKVSLNYNGLKETVECYLYNDKYHTAKSRFINPEYITKIENL